MEYLQTGLIVGLQLVLGKLVKSNPKLANGLIFWINWAVGTLSNVIAPHLAKPAEASTSGVVLQVVQNPILMGLIQSVLATGIHSTAKNTWQMIKKALNL